MPGDNPILNNPYEEPRLHYHTDSHGQLDYERILSGRRPFSPYHLAIPVRQGQQPELYDATVVEYDVHLVNLVRREVGVWRESQYQSPAPTRITGDLLRYWFLNPDRPPEQQMFFAQREAVETAVWLNEIAPACNHGQSLLAQLQDVRHVSDRDSAANLPRIAFKMATGSGKTVVMAALILYHFYNRQENRNDTRFADHFLIVAPGITVRDRLAVLFADLERKGGAALDYYHQRALIPHGPAWEGLLGQLNARITITNYHTFEPKVLQGNKRSPFDGKAGPDGGKIKPATESIGQVLRRLLPAVKPSSRLLVLNDEAHHCYLPKPKAKPKGDDAETAEENSRAAVWFNGLAEINRRFAINSVYDLSATPYYLGGSGYDPYSLFPWVVSDFGLVEAIESGLVKIPFLPINDSAQAATEMPVLRDLYEYAKDDLPKMGQKKARAKAKKDGAEIVGELPPNLPSVVKNALEQFHRHYAESFDQVRGLYDSPPVFIAVCNNTAVSKELYKYIAGYEKTLSDGSTQVVPGHFDILSNYDLGTRQPRRRPPTLLIDSDALEHSGQIDADFHRIFAPEIAMFRKEYAIRHGQGAANAIGEAEILREVVNTVGKGKNLLGSHIRCVVSVSMLTEGWDANTVTHIMGLRAFGSQLLCEQVAGRALRRKNYVLQAYRRDTGEPVPQENVKRHKPEKLLWKFPPEYAHIIGIPFNMFKGGTSQPVDPPPTFHIRALREREAYEIGFPNIIGYRVETHEAIPKADFSGIEPFQVDLTAQPTRTTLASAVSPDEAEINVEHILSMRDQPILYGITKELLNQHFSDGYGKPRFHLFDQLLRIVREWYDTKLVAVGAPTPEHKRLVLFADEKSICNHILRGIHSATVPTDVILPILNYYNREGSTRHVHGVTAKDVWPTLRKCHVNAVVADTAVWEQSAAKAFEDLECVEAYVKNAFLGFAIPYVDEKGKERQYLPDFLLKVRSPHGGEPVSLIVEITGFNQDKKAKKWCVENRWLPAVNRDGSLGRWYFLEVSDIKLVKNQVAEFARSLK